MSQEFKRVGVDVRMVRLQPWKLWLLAAVGVALAVTLAIAMAGLLLILVPVLLVAGFVARLILGRAAAPARPTQGTPVIEGQFEVIERPTGRWRR